MADGLPCQDRQMDYCTVRAHIDETCDICCESRNLLCVRLRGHDAHAHPMRQSSRACSHRVQPRVLKVNMMRMRAEGEGERLREHPEYAHTAHQIAVLESATAICGEVVGM